MRTHTDIMMVLLASAVVLVLDIGLYFVPAYIATRPKKIKDADIISMTQVTMRFMPIIQIIFLRVGNITVLL